MYNLKKTRIKFKIVISCLVFILPGLILLGMVIYHVFYINGAHLSLDGSNIGDIIRGEPVLYQIILIGGICVLVGISLLCYYIKKKKIYKFLSEHGTLIKNHPYRVVKHSSGRYGHCWYLVVDFKLPDGKIIRMSRDYNEFEKKDKKNDRIDILYDPLKPKNYYLQFGIEEIDDEKIDNEKIDDKIIEL